LPIDAACQIVSAEDFEGAERECGSPDGGREVTSLLSVSGLVLLVGRRTLEHDLLAMRGATGAAPSTEGLAAESAAP
jgi:hypothetical protein